MNRGGAHKRARPYYYIATEMGTSGLYDQLKTISEMPHNSQKHLFFQLIVGMLELHAQGCLHNDIKPRNVVFVHRPDVPACTYTLEGVVYSTRPLPLGFPVYIDLGGGLMPCIATHGEDLQIVGTTRYKPPEAFYDIPKNKRQHRGFTSDVYGLGVTLIYAVLGKTRVEGPGSSVREALAPLTGTRSAPGRNLGDALVVQFLIGRSLDALDSDATRALETLGLRPDEARRLIGQVRSALQSDHSLHQARRRVLAHPAQPILARMCSWDRKNRIDASGSCAWALRSPWFSALRTSAAKARLQPPCVTVDLDSLYPFSHPEKDQGRIQRQRAELAHFFSRDVPIAPADLIK